MKFQQGFSQSQVQKQSQKLVMTQQLQQSIKMLSFSTDELLQYLENKTLENPLLEVTIKTDEYESPDYQIKQRGENEASKEWLNQVPNNQLSLFDYLIQQIHLNYRDTPLRTWVMFLLEFIDVNGYLSIELEEAMETTGASYIDMLDALTLLQMLEPAGVGARNLQECLMLQTERDDEAPKMAYLVLEEQFEHLANRQWKKIEKAYDMPLTDIQVIFDYIKKLTPFPGSAFSQDQELYITPDLIVQVRGESIDVLSTKRGAPELTFQQSYFEKMSQTDDQEVARYLKERKEEFDWLKKGVEQRGNTILRVGEEIVKRQVAFFTEAKRELVPMLMKDVAKALDLHESTISRSVNGKYLQTEFGTFELRSFFTTGLTQTDSTDDVSSQVIKQQIKEMVEQENKQKPLSDQKMADFLKEKDVIISRRTVAKYREELGIQSSSKRKRYDS